MSGYLLGFEKFSVNEFILLIMGGFFVTGSANGFNQILERNHDKLMTRTCSRPLPMGNLTIIKALIFSLSFFFWGGTSVRRPGGRPLTFFFNTNTTTTSHSETATKNYY